MHKLSSFSLSHSKSYTITHHERGILRTPRNANAVPCKSKLKYTICGNISILFLNYCQTKYIRLQTNHDDIIKQQSELSLMTRKNCV